MRSLWLVLLLSGCAALARAPDPRPALVILYRDTLTVQMSDGALCIGLRPQGPQRWSGVLQGCATPLGFAVLAEPHRAREVLAPAGGAGRVLVDGRAYGAL